MMYCSGQLTKLYYRRLYNDNDDDDDDDDDDNTNTNNNNNNSTHITNVLGFTSKSPMHHDLLPHKITDFYSRICVCVCVCVYVFVL